MEERGEVTDSSVAQGLRYMALGAFWFSVMGLLVKLAGQRVPVMEIVLVRAVVSLALSYVMLKRARVPIWGSNRRLLLLRGVLGFGALASFYYGIVHLSLAEATMIQYTSPVFTALFAAWWLRERLSAREAVCVAASLGGVVMIARPTFLFGGSSVLDPTAVGIALFGAVLSGAAYTVVRSLGRREDPLVIVFYFPLVTIPASLPFVLPVAVWPTGSEWLILLGIGVTTQIAQVSITKGLQRVPAARAAAVGYLQIAFAGVWGALIFAEIPDRWSYAGAAMIVGSTLALSMWRKRQATETATAQLTAAVQMARADAEAPAARRGTTSAD
jgi:drug/metabolite transporter (DMT)-like permease